MADVYPFIGTRYNSQLIGNLGSVISPPFDMINAELQKHLYDQHENNIVRIEFALGGDEDDEMANPYSRAANTLGTWRSDGIFIEDERPSFYLYEQVYKDADGATHSRLGFLAKAKLDEQCPIDIESAPSLSGGKGDRLNLLRSTKANVSPVTSLFDDADATVLELLKSKAAERPWEEITDADGVIHRLWVMQKKDTLLRLMELLKDKKLFVADGHQRYVAAQLYRDEMRQESGKADGKQPYDFVMTLVLPAQQESVRPLPVHRALTKSIMMDVDLKEALEEIAENFDVHKEKFDVAGGAAEGQRLQLKLAELGGENITTIALLHSAGTAFFLTKKEGVEVQELYDDSSLSEWVSSTDSCILHHYIINQVMIGNPEYELEDDECIHVYSAGAVLDMMKSKKAVCGIIMNPLSIAKMFDMANKDAQLPFESSVLSPRPATGLVLRNMQTDIVKSARK